MMALVILILCGAARKVHMVFNNQYLMQRDHIDAANMLKLLGITDEQVEYHSTLEFELNEGEFVIIDEADDIIFNQTAQFIEKFASCRYLCFTATGAATPAEDGLMESIKLKAYEYMLNNGVTQYDLSADSVTASTAEAKVSYIKQLSATSPVLVYGPEELCMKLVMQCGALYVNTSVNPQQLRALDQRDPFSNAYKIIVCNDMFGMRGIDYRSNSVTLALVIA